MNSSLEIGSLYKLNPKYDNSNGKAIYRAEPFQKESNFAPLGPGFAAPWAYACAVWYPEEPVLVLEKEITFPYIVNFKEAIFIKILLQKEIFYFPCSIYMEDILIPFK